MPIPRPRPRVLIAVVAVALTAGAVTVWVATSAPEESPVRLPGSSVVATTAPVATTVAPTTVAGLAEPGTRTPVAPPVSARRLVAAAERAAAPGMTLGVAVLDVHTGELVVGRDGAREFMAASLAKLIVAVDVLDRHRARGRPLDPEDADLIRRALADSDDGAMNVLWGRHDGAGAVGRVADLLGLAAHLPAGSAKMWGDLVVTAADMVAVYRHVLRDMNPRDGAVIVGALSGTGAVAADGFGQHYGLLGRGASASAYAKQAWVPWAPAGYLLHSAGVVHDARTGHRYAIALLSVQPYTSEQTARDRLSSVAAAATAALVT